MFIVCSSLHDQSSFRNLLSFPNMALYPLEIASLSTSIFKYVTFCMLIFVQYSLNVSYSSLLTSNAILLILVCLYCLSYSVLLKVDKKTHPFTICAYCILSTHYIYLIFRYGQYVVGMV